MFFTGETFSERLICSHPLGRLKTENLFSFTPPPPPRVIKSRFFDFRNPPLDFRNLPKFLPIIGIVIHCTHGVRWTTESNKKLTVTVSTCKILQVLTITVTFLWKKSTVSAKFYRCWHLQSTFISIVIHCTHSVRWTTETVTKSRL